MKMTPQIVSDYWYKEAKRLKEENKRLQTFKDNGSIGQFGQTDLLTQDTSILNFNDLNSRGNARLTVSKTQRREGDVSGLGLPTLNPGDMIRMSEPYSELTDRYQVLRFTHTISSSSGFLTDAIIAKYPKSIGSQLSILNKNLTNQLIAKNQFGMRNSYVITFDENPSIMSHVGTEESDSNLQLKGGTIGNATSAIRSYAENITHAELRFDGDNLGISSFEVSNNNGVNFQTIIEAEEIEFATSGKSLRIKINLQSDSDNPNPRVHTMGVFVR